MGMIQFFLRSVGYAIKGIIIASGERNLRIQSLVAVVVCILGFFFGITRTEWIIIVFCIGLVMSMEIMNTAIEHIVDLISPEFNPIAGRIKDLAAGAVLVMSLMSAIIGMVIFTKYVLAFF
jgi:diacylglycerol kinase (ATP)